MTNDPLDAREQRLIERRRRALRSPWVLAAWWAVAAIVIGPHRRWSSGYIRSRPPDRTVTAATASWWAS